MLLFRIGIIRDYISALQFNRFSKSYTSIIAVMLSKYDKLNSPSTARNIFSFHTFGFIATFGLFETSASDLGAESMQWEESLYMMLVPPPSFRFSPCQYVISLIEPDMVREPTYLYVRMSHCPWTKSFSFSRPNISGLILGSWT